MKALIVIIFLMLLIPVLFDNSYAKYYKDPNGTIVFMQSIIRNSEGQLVGYMEGYPQVFYLDALIDWLEPRAEKSIVTINGKTYEMLHSKDGSNWSVFRSYGAYYLTLPIGDDGVKKTVIYFHQDSFIVLPGDTLQIYYTILRPIG